MGMGGEVLRLFDAGEPERSPRVTGEQVEAVFDHWVTVHRTGRPGPRPVLSAKRRAKITQAITDYGVDTCRDAISGCALSGWHMGDNPRRRRYDDIELILRDAAHIERFATLFAEGGDDGYDDARAAFLADGDPR